jgi:hypothetical protein
MKTQIVYLRFVGEDGREIPMSAPEKEKWMKKHGKLLYAFFGSVAMLAVGIVIGIVGGGGSGGFTIKTIRVENLTQNRMS